MRKDTQEEQKFVTSATNTLHENENQKDPQALEPTHTTPVTNKEKQQIPRKPILRPVAPPYRRRSDSGPEDESKLNHPQHYLGIPIGGQKSSNKPKDYLDNQKLFRQIQRQMEKEKKQKELSSQTNQNEQEEEHVPVLQSIASQHIRKSHRKKKNISAIEESHVSQNVSSLLGSEELPQNGHRESVLTSTQKNQEASDLVQWDIHNSRNIPPKSPHKSKKKHHKTNSQQTNITSTTPTPAFLSKQHSEEFSIPKEESSFLACYFFLKEVMGLLEPAFFALVGTSTGLDFLLGSDAALLFFFTGIGLYVLLSAFGQTNHLLKEQRLIEGFLYSLMIFFVGTAVILTWLDKTLGLTLYITKDFLLGPAAFIVSLTCGIVANICSLIKHSYEYYHVNSPLQRREHLQKILLSAVKLLFYSCAIVTLLLLFSQAAPEITLLITIMASTSAGLCTLERLYRFFIYREEHAATCGVFFRKNAGQESQNKRNDDSNPSLCCLF